MTMRTLPITLCDNYYRVGATGTPSGGAGPAITTHPANTTVASGASGNFSCVATGTAPLHYVWYKNGIAIAGAADVYTYSTPPTVPADSGSLFKCFVWNLEGGIMSNAGTLTVTGSSNAPAFTTHPSNAYVALGAPVTFTVVVTGGQPIGYQWYKSPNGSTWAVINGATNASYTISSTNSGDAGYYRCTATNAYGTANSNAATLQFLGANTVLVAINTPTQIEFNASAAVSAAIGNPATLTSEPTTTAFGAAPVYIASTFPPVYTTQLAGHIQQNPPGFAMKIMEYQEFAGYPNPGFTAAPTLTVRPVGVSLKTPDGVAISYIRVKVYYGSTLKSTLKVYDSNTIASEIFPQNLTYTLSTDATYTTYALVMANLKVRIEMEVEPGSPGYNGIQFGDWAVPVYCFAAQGT
jgi:hypothetical protein